MTFGRNSWKWILTLTVGGSALVIAALLRAATLPEKVRPFDKDGDGKLSAQEFWDRELFARIDRNRDGFVTAAELILHYTKNPPRPEVKSAPATIRPGAAQRTQRTPEESFAFLDRDADALLSEQEMEPLHDIVPYFRDNPGTLAAVFKQLDANLDGGLSLEEFRGMYTLAQPGRGGAAAKAAPRKTAPPASTVSPALAASEDKPRNLAPDERAFFEKNIRPVLVEHCYKCHSDNAEKVKGGLVLDSRAGLREGGDSGPAIVPGNPEQSLLIEAIRYKNEDLQMPPEKNGGKLPDRVITLFEEWVKMGAPDPRTGDGNTARAASIEKGRDYWAFRPVAHASAPAVQDSAWPRSDIDRFVLEALETRGLKPVGDASRRDLLRRVYFDLTGLPPRPEEIDAFVADPDPNAFAKIVDRLLASPQFGERWGRHWLDVARYADSSGRGSNILFPEAWRYRDYVIAAFNADKPYDQFVREQIAGDLLPAKDDAQRAEQTIATGFLALGPKELAEKDRLQFQLDLVDEQLDTVGQAMLGLTIGCARCHDHKFDPIPQRDYYALAGIFRSTETRYGTVAVITNAHPASLVELPAGQPTVSAPGMTREKLRAEQQRLDQELRALTGGAGLESYQLPQEPDKLRPFILTRSQLVIVNGKLRELDANGKPRPFAMGVKDKSNPADMPLYLRGEPTKPSQPVPRGMLQVLGGTTAPIAAGSGRRELADWIASRENPLTARVAVNRLWHHLFGRGLVTSVDNFGAMGSRPSHPALLDHLALRFVAQGWSVKKLLREVVLSRVYQLATTYEVSNYTADPENTLLWRMTPRRLDAEAARDAMLAVSGRLELRPPLGSIAARIGNNFTNAAAAVGNREALSGMRSVYLTVLRDQINDALAPFDFANSNVVAGEREQTTTPAQTLFLLNSPIMQSLADAWARRLAEVSTDGGARIRAAYRQAFGREPTERELRATEEFFERFEAANDGTPRRERGPLALTTFCQALLASAEFRTLN